MHGQQNIKKKYWYHTLLMEKTNHFCQPDVTPVDRTSKEAAVTDITIPIYKPKLQENK